MKYMFSPTSYFNRSFASHIQYVVPALLITACRLLRIDLAIQLIDQIISLTSVHYSFSTCVSAILPRPLDCHARIIGRSVNLTAYIIFSNIHTFQN